MDPTSLLTGLALGVLIGVALGLLVARLAVREQQPGAPELDKVASGQAVLQVGLERLQDQLADMQQQRASWQSQLSEQVRSVQDSAHQMRQETNQLSQALRQPQVRGQWGELHLRRAVELAGMVAHCDFVEQPTIAGGTQRPDLIVRLAGGRQLVVDSKVPLSAFLDLNHLDGEVAAQALARHARLVRQHVDSLSSKAYWKSVAGSAEFVVLFMPGEAFLSSALESDPSLLEHAAIRRVVLATPSTLIALLRTVAHAWSQAELAEQAEEIVRAGRDLHDRLDHLSKHFARVSRSLSSTVTAFNSAMGSYESRVLVSARRFEHLGQTTLEAPSAVQVTPRSVVSAPPESAWDEPA